MIKTPFKYTLDLNNLPKPSPKQLALIKALAEKPDEEIDYSDLPQITAEQWENSRLARDNPELQKALGLKKHQATH